VRAPESIIGRMDSAGAHEMDRTRRLLPGRSWYGFAAQLLPPAHAAGRWVDFGCGRGEFLTAMAGHAGRGVGLDYWESNAGSVRASGHASVVADLNRPLPFRDGSLDGASLIEVVEHIVRAEALVDELARVVRPGGWLLVTTPNVAHLRYRMRALTGHPPKQEGYHFRFFTRGTLDRLFAERGFLCRSRASYGTSTVRSRLGRLLGRGRKFKHRARVPSAFESLLSTHFVWLLQRQGAHA
jgi:SAM-dependent methyltransferase